MHEAGKECDFASAVLFPTLRSCQAESSKGCAVLLLSIGRGGCGSVSGSG
jgi:hypothetical protein